MENALARLIEAFRVLPGVGQKSAQRMVYYLMQHNRPGAARLGDALLHAVQNISHCIRCNTFSEVQICETCSDPQRDQTLLCVVETPADQLMLEQAMTYKGLYFVLMGHLSPLDGVGPYDLHFDRLIQRATDGVVTEVILATNFTSESEATAHYLGQMLKPKGLHVTRLARGVPVGGELEYVDAGTLARAVLDRRAL